MGFKCGIVGLPNVGKSTLFNALTETAAAQAANYPFCTIEPNVGEVAVPDPRLDKLAEVGKSAQIIPMGTNAVTVAGGTLLDNGTVPGVVNVLAGGTLGGGGAIPNYVTNRGRRRPVPRGRDQRGGGYPDGAGVDKVVLGRREHQPLPGVGQRPHERPGQLLPDRLWGDADGDHQSGGQPVAPQQQLYAVQWILWLRGELQRH